MTGLNKFVAIKFLDYKIIDSKHIVTQFQELQVIIHVILDKGLIINDALQVVALVEKFPSSWKDIKNYFKY